jgi:O-antigen/teichoic acid export membrane protein
MERLFSAATFVVLLWAAFNTLLAVMLAGFIAAGFYGGAGRASFLPFGVYAVSTTIIFLTALAVWIGRRRRRGLNEPPRAAAAVLLALGVAMAWTGLAVGAWAAYLGAAVVLAGIVYELYPRMRP